MNQRMMEKKIIIMKKREKMMMIKMRSLKQKRLGCIRRTARKWRKKKWKNTKRKWKRRKEKRGNIKCRSTSKSGKKKPRKWRNKNNCQITIQFLHKSTLTLFCFRKRKNRESESVISGMRVALLCLATVSVSCERLNKFIKSFEPLQYDTLKGSPNPSSG